MHGDPGKLIGDRLVLDGDLHEKLDKFRAEVVAKMVNYWHKPGDLPGQGALAILQVRKSHLVEGWIRARESMTLESRRNWANGAMVREQSADLHDEQRRYLRLVDAAELEHGDLRH